MDHLQAVAVAEHFGHSAAHVHFWKHQLTGGKIDFSEPVSEGSTARYRVTAESRRKFRYWPEKDPSTGEIAQLLPEDGVDISVCPVSGKVSDTPDLIQSAGLPNDS